MARIRDWQRNREMWVRLLEKQTGESVDDWNRRIKRQRFGDEQALRNWLSGLGLRLDGQRPTGRLQPSTIHETMKLQIGLTRCEDVDDDVLRWLARAYRENS